MGSLVPARAPGPTADGAFRFLDHGVKLYTTLLLALGVALAVYLARKRIKLALTVGFLTYAVLLPIRLLFAAGDLSDRVGDLVGISAAVGAVWVVLWWISTRYERRKRARQAASGQRPRPAWWRLLR